MHICQLEQNSLHYVYDLHDNRDKLPGIEHVIGPELGLTQPGMTIVCGDSHTSTHGAFGTLAFGIGTTQVIFTSCPGRSVLAKRSGSESTSPPSM